MILLFWVRLLHSLVYQDKRQACSRGLVVEIWDRLCQETLNSWWENLAHLQPFQRDSTVLFKIIEDKHRASFIPWKRIALICHQHTSQCCHKTTSTLQLQVHYRIRSWSLDHRKPRHSRGPRLIKDRQMKREALIQLKRLVKKLSVFKLTSKRIIVTLRHLALSRHQLSSMRSETRLSWFSLRLFQSYQRIALLRVAITRAKRSKEMRRSQHNLIRQIVKPFQR